MSVLVSYTEEDARPHLYIPTQLDDAIQAANAALQLMMCALDLKDGDKIDAMQTARHLCFRTAALISRQIEGV